MGKLSDFKNNGQNVSEEEIKDKFDYYKDMSSQELSNELAKEVARQKGNGSFDYQKLNSMVESLRGSIPEESYQNVKRILDSIR